MRSVAARSLGTSASIMRPTSPYLEAPPLVRIGSELVACRSEIVSTDAMGRIGVLPRMG